MKKIFLTILTIVIGYNIYSQCPSDFKDDDEYWYFQVNTSPSNFKYVPCNACTPIYDLNSNLGFSGSYPDSLEHYEPSDYPEIEYLCTDGAYRWYRIPITEPNRVVAKEENPDKIVYQVVLNNPILDERHTMRFKFDIESGSIRLIRIIRFGLTPAQDEEMEKTD